MEYSYRSKPKSETGRDTNGCTAFVIAQKCSSNSWSTFSAPGVTWYFVFRTVHLVLFKPKTDFSMIATHWHKNTTSLILYRSKIVSEVIKSTSIWNSTQSGDCECFKCKPNWKQIYNLLIFPCNNESPPVLLKRYAVSLGAFESLSVVPAPDRFL